jgi:hypothetical protein
MHAAASDEAVIGAPHDEGSSDAAALPGDETVVLDGAERPRQAGELQPAFAFRHGTEALVTVRTIEATFTVGRA